MTPTTRTWVDNGTLDSTDSHRRRSAQGRSRWRTTRSGQARKKARPAAQREPWPVRPFTAMGQRARRVRWAGPDP